MAAWRPCWISCYRYSSRSTIDADTKPSAMNLVGPVVASNWDLWPWLIQDGCQGGHFEIGFWNLICDVQTWNSYKKQWQSLHFKQSRYWNSNDEGCALFRSIIWIERDRLATKLNFLLSLLLQTDIRCRHETKCNVVVWACSCVLLIFMTLTHPRWLPGWPFWNWLLKPYSQDLELI